MIRLAPLGVLLTGLAAGAPASAAPLGIDADECAIQRALLGKAGPGCPPEAARPEPPVAPPPPAPAALPAAPAQPPPVAAAPKPPPPQAPAPPVAAERKADFLIQFDFASATLSKESEPLLHRIAATMNAPAAAGMGFDIIGHTDGVGSDAANLALSQRRAAMVKVWLAKQGEVDARRLTASGMGKARLADPTQPAAAVNRRVEIIARPAR